MSVPERAPSVPEMEREAAAASAAAPAARKGEIGREPLAMLLRRGFHPSVGELDLPFDEGRVDARRLADTLDRYAARLFLRGAIARPTGFLPEETSRFLTPENAAPIAEELLSLGLLERAQEGRLRLVLPARSFGGTLEWYVAHELAHRYRFDAVAGVKFHAPGVGGDLDVIAAAEGKLLSIELKSSPPKHLKEPELDAFVLRTRALRPDITIFAMDTALRLADKVIPMLEEAVGRAGGAPAVRRVEREVWALSPHVYAVNAKPSLMGNIGRAIAEGLFALSPMPI